jgi:hypothetical protein
MKTRFNKIESGKMVLERESKIAIIFITVLGLVVVYQAAGTYQRSISSKTNSTFYNIPLSIIAIFIITLILSIVLYFRKKRAQQDYLASNIKGVTTLAYAKIPKNMDGLYLIIVFSGYGLVSLLYFSFSFATTPGYNPNAQTVYFFIVALIVVCLFLFTFSLRSLVKQKRNPQYETYLPCPRCDSTDVNPITYVFYPIFPSSETTMVRCNKCGQKYNGYVETTHQSEKTRQRY